MRIQSFATHGVPTILAPVINKTRSIWMPSANGHIRLSNVRVSFVHKGGAIHAVENVSLLLTGRRW